VLRARSGFDINQMASEYRALRASVLRLWFAAVPAVGLDDVEDLMRFNEAIDQALAESLLQFSREVERSRALLLGVLGHDLRNPLSAIVTGARLLEHRAESDEIATPARRILSSAQRMARMIDQLLDVTRIRQGQGIPLRRAPVDLARICALAVEELERPGNGPATVELLGDASGSWDGDRLMQLLSNLVGNALAHGTPGTPVVVRIDGTGAVVRLDVCNAGAVPADVLPFVFQPMHGASGDGERMQRGSGLGLGLFISRGIVVAHGGTIDVVSSEADGTRVTITLPRS